ncbi:hypothetical protein KB1_14890 [Cutibacterium modestum]|uniref:Uncharacterized protein n=1 Tax=Cutibacterium modestum TaxID=2559073 RepID=A0AAD1KQW7_9ACTN|nr:hypothetical protein KB1_14890 [Cutibacterium modestum]
MYRVCPSHHGEGRQVSKLTTIQILTLKSDSPSVGRRSMLKVFPDVQDSINAQLDAQQPAAGNDRGRIHAWQHSD